MTTTNKFDFEFSEGVLDTADRILLFGPPMVGKTTWASQFPDPIFIDAEDGTKKLRVARVLRKGQSPFDAMDDAGNWTRALAAVEWVATAPHKYRTLVIDTIDKLEHFAKSWVCKNIGYRNAKKELVEAKTLDEVGGGFGRGDLAVVEQFRKLLGALDCCSRRGITVVLLGHEHIETMKTPNNTDYPRYALQTGKKVSELLLKEFDYVLHAMPHTDVLTKLSFGNEKSYTRNTGVRYLHCGLDSTRATKCRLPLPARMIFDYPTFAEAMQRAGDPMFVRTSVEEKIALVTNPVKAKAMRETLEACGGLIEKMADLTSRIDDYLARQEAAAVSNEPAAVQPS